MQPLAGFASCQHGGGGGGVGHVCRHFRIFFVDSQFLGRVFKSISSSGMKIALKNWAGIDSFPFTDLLSLNILRQFWPNAPFRPFLHEGIK